MPAGPVSRLANRMAATRPKGNREEEGAPAHLQPDGVLVLPLHVVDVPRHPLHGVDGFLHHLVRLRVLLHVVGDLLRAAGQTHTHTRTEPGVSRCGRSPADAFLKTRRRGSRPLSAIWGGIWLRRWTLVLIQAVFM